MGISGEIGGNFVNGDQKKFVFGKISHWRGRRNVSGIVLMWSDVLV